MAITSQLRGGVFGDILVQDWQATKLLKPSTIKPAFATLEQGLVIKTLGKLSQSDSQALKQMIGKILG
jgi:mRNA interferase MazF